MVALVVSLTGALALGLTSWVPRVLERDIGVSQPEPELLTVAAEAKGAVTLGEGFTIALEDSGFRIAHVDGTMADSVTRGAPVSAILGRLDHDETHPRENVTKTLDRVNITGLELYGHTARYSGTVSGQGESLPLLVDARRIGHTVQLLTRVAGADAVVLHFRKVPAVMGLPPALPAKNLRLNAWWVEPGTGGAELFTWVLGTTIGVGPQDATRAVDLRPDGLLSVHVWSEAATLTVSGTPRRG